MKNIPNLSLLFPGRNTSLGNDSLFLNAFLKKTIDIFIQRESLISPFGWKHLALCTRSIKSYEPGLPHLSATAVILFL